MRNFDAAIRLAGYFTIPVIASAIERLHHIDGLRIGNYALNMFFTLRKNDAMLYKFTDNADAPAPILR